MHRGRDLNPRPLGYERHHASRPNRTPPVTPKHRNDFSVSHSVGIGPRRRPFTDRTRTRVGTRSTGWGSPGRPTEAWIKQVARNSTDTDDGFLRDVRYRILDRDPLYTRAFRSLLRESGVKTLRLPARSPNLKRLRGAVRAVDQVGVGMSRALLRIGEQRRLLKTV